MSRVYKGIRLLNSACEYHERLQPIAGTIESVKSGCHPVLRINEVNKAKTGVTTSKNPAGSVSKLLSLTAEQREKLYNSTEPQISK
jgi:hypothetical protein